MMVKHAWALILICLSASVHATSESAYLTSYVQELYKHHRDYLEFVPTGQEDSRPSGGYLFRFKTQANDQGTSIVFIAPDISLTKGGPFWTTYLLKSDGELTTVSRMLSIWPESLWVRKEGAGNVYSFIERADDSWHVTHFALVDGESLKVWNSEMPGHVLDFLARGDSKANEALAQLGLGDKYCGKLEKVMLDVVVKTRYFDWRPVNKKFSREKQFLDPADKKQFLEFRESAYRLVPGPVSSPE